MKQTIYYNPLDKACKSVTGAIKERENLRFNLFLLKDNAQDLSYALQTPNIKDCETPNKNAFLHINRDGEEYESIAMQKTAFGWTITLKIAERGLYYYTFYIENIGYVSCGRLQMGEITPNPKGFLLTVHTQDYQTPAWFKGGNMYQIFPDRFCKQGAMPDIKGRVAREDWGGMPSFRPNDKGKV